jgi:queuosine precursor transporter
MEIEEKRERVFIVLSAFFFASMTLLNIVGLTRFIHFGPLALAVGVLPYPLTFLVTDLISELYGKSRANFVVWVGLVINIFVIAFLFIGQWATSVGPESQPPWQVLYLSRPVMLATGEQVSGSVDLFYLIYSCAAGSVLASMLAYITAQFFDVQIFHYLKKKTRGKALWLRNNVSTLCSQAIDSVVVIGVTFGWSLYEGSMGMKAFFVLMGSNYIFKMTAALLDTLPLYLLVNYLRRYLHMPS